MIRRRSQRAACVCGEIGELLLEVEAFEILDARAPSRIYVGVKVHDHASVLCVVSRIDHLPLEQCVRWARRARLGLHSMFIAVVALRPTRDDMGKSVVKGQNACSRTLTPYDVVRVGEDDNVESGHHVGHNPVCCVAPSQQATKRHRGRRCVDGESRDQRTHTCREAKDDLVGAPAADEVVLLAPF